MIHIHWPDLALTGLRRDPLAFPARAAARGDLGRIGPSRHPVFFANHPTFIRHVPQKRPPVFRVRPLFGDGLITADGVRWHRTRRAPPLRRRSSHVCRARVRNGGNDTHPDGSRLSLPRASRFRWPCSCRNQRSPRSHPSAPSYKSNAAKFQREASRNLFPLASFGRAGAAPALALFIDMAALVS